jgi:hypothetical protein
MGFWWITLVSIYLVVVAVIVVHGLVVLWPANAQQGRNPAAPGASPTPTATPANGATATPAPTATPGATPAATPTVTPATRATPATRPTPSPTPATGATKVTGSIAICQGDQAGQESASLFGQQLCLSMEERMFWIVLLSGALGGLVHSLRSFAWYAGNRKLVVSWTAFYMTLPVVGATMAVIFYLVIRGGFFPQAQIAETSPFGFAALAVLVGMFTEEAAVKLKEVASTLLNPAEKGKDQATSAPTVSGVDPNTGALAGGTPVTVKGKSFDKAAQVNFGGKAGTKVVVAADGTQLTTLTPAGASAGAVAVEVVNPGNLKGSLANGFTYQAAAAPPPPAAGGESGAGGAGGAGAGAAGGGT